MPIDQLQLDQLRQTLQADDYRLDVHVQGDRADVVIGVRPESIRLTYPADSG